jgi:DNA-binding MarR family transcriptional regulator
VPTVTPELEAKKAQAEQITSAAVAAYFDVLSDEERQAIRDGALAMQEAVKNPVPVSQ